MTLPANRDRLPRLDLPRRPKGLRFEVEPVADPRREVRLRGDAADIEIFDIIGDGGATPAWFSAALKRAGNRRLRVAINSPGGDVFDGIAIYNQIRAHPAGVSVEVLGIAASAASVIAMAGDEITMARNSQLMVHNTWILVVGNADILAKTQDLLRKIDGQLAETYSARSGQSIETVGEMMRAETFMTADEAVDLGFADGLLEQDAAPAPQMRSGPPGTVRQLEAGLRRIGFSKAEARTAAAASWQALSAAPEQPGANQLTERISQAFGSIQAKREERERSCRRW